MSRKKPHVPAALCGALLASTAAAEEGSMSGAASLEEVVVTAQKFEQSIQDTPLSITALSGEGLRELGIENAQAFQGRIPGLSLHEVGAGLNIQIRGIGSTSAAASSDPTATFNVDGVVHARPMSSNGLFYDVARLEVLRGPQGTLYGRNSTVGAINVISNAPTSTEAASATVEAGNFGLVRFEAMLNVPLSDRLMARFAGQSVKRQGYLSNGDSDADDIAGRARLLWQPSDRLSILTTADYAHRGGQGFGVVLLEDGRVAAATPAGASPANNAFFTPASNDPKSTWLSTWNPNSLEIRDWGVTTQIDYDLDWASLVAQPAFRYNYSYAYGPGSGIPAYGNSLIEADQPSFETRLSSNADSPLRWVAGLFYYQEKVHQLLLGQSIITPVAPATDNRRRAATDATFTTHSYAAFAQATLPITAAFRVTAGVRYSEDEKELNGRGYSYTYLDTGPQLSQAAIEAKATGRYPLQTEGTFESLDWKGGVEFDVTDSMLLYASASTGFKAGGGNIVDDATAPASSPRTYEPEEMLEYALGSKNSLLNGRLVVNLQGYYWEYDHRQQLNRVTISTATTPNPAAFINANLGSAEIYGGELEINWLATDHDRVSLQAAYNRGEYLADDPDNFISASLDLRGVTVPFQAPWQGVFDYEHRFDLRNGASVVAGYHAQYKSEHFVETRNRWTQDAYAKHDVTIDYSSASGRYRTGVWVRNLSNEAVVSSAITGNIAPNPMLGTMEPPRTYGVNFTVEF